MFWKLKPSIHCGWKDVSIVCASLLVPIFGNCGLPSLRRIRFGWILFRPTFGCDLSSEIGRKAKFFWHTVVQLIGWSLCHIEWCGFFSSNWQFNWKTRPIWYFFSLWFWDSIFLSCVRFSNQMIYCVTFSPSDELHMGIILMIRFFSSYFSCWASVASCSMRAH